VVDISHLPQNDKTNGWNLVLPQRTPKPALKGDVKADWVVAGAGYAGLAAARRLAVNRPGDRIVLLDAGVMGENASARNSGFAIDLPHAVGGGHDGVDGGAATARKRWTNQRQLSMVRMGGAGRCTAIIETRLSGFSDRPTPAIGKVPWRGTSSSPAAWCPHSARGWLRRRSARSCRRAATRCA
jgi:hypothetical protein